MPKEYKLLPSLGPHDEHAASPLCNRLASGFPLAHTTSTPRPRLFAACEPPLSHPNQASLHRVEGLLLCNRLLSGLAALCVSVKANEALPAARETREFK